MDGVTYPARPDLGVSPNALSIARIIDRLPLGGEYAITLEKPDYKGEPWQVKVSRVETLRETQIDKEE